jgi:hypothetical protein
VKVLLDENLPHDLRRHLPGHAVFTVRYMRWDGLKNGALLREAANAGFGAFVTLDNGVKYQQNISSLALAVIVLHARSNDIDDLLPLVSELIAALAGATAGRVFDVA